MHDDTRPHIALPVTQFWAKHEEVEKNCLPYCPNLAPADFFLSPKLKNLLKRTRFEDVEDIKKTVTTELKTPQLKLHKILWVAVSSAIGLCVERRHHLQSVCLQDVVSVDQIDENRLRLSLVGQCHSIHLTLRLSPKRFSCDDDDES
ncbi:hypothetical protein AVEN_133986-1 [Araneus ventricosus]|uniref:Histone-lysine N-methyltransferase SETMAR n=1 Tax=Araneus ventricosus TaxID=182803 RepID=A0A4Y2JBP7_ARAVE|nr:hypothetical protein AVEN_133986-1 [Araneus ventricosus]